MKIGNEHVVAALDLSRVETEIKNIATKLELKDSLLIGQEVDLLEIMRRQDNPEDDFFNMPIEQALYYGASIGIDPVLMERVVLKNLQEYDLIEIDNENIEILYKDSNEVFKYGINQINNNLSKNEKNLLDIIQKGRIRPVNQIKLDNVIENFPEKIQKSIESILVNTKILSPLQAKEDLFYSSPKLYKNENSFRELMEYNDGNEISNALEFLCDNPGIPLESISPKELNHNLLNGLTISGALDSINLNINGHTRNYLLPSILSSNRTDKDQLDQVKKTLANFRFAERYAQFNLNNLTRFFEVLLNKGYAGRATPIGTDYRNLEACGIIKVEKVEGSIHRLWMLKKDVIEDTLNVLKGSVPLIEKNPNIDLSRMDDSTYSRMIIDKNEGKNTQEITDAIRQLERSLL